MTLPTSGAISLQAVATEFSGGTLHPLESYYAGAGFVNAQSNTGWD